ncbi:MAG: AsnC family transcriptional regulator, partial [Enterococcus sp.]
MIDQTDLAILKVLSNDSRIKIKALSKEVALSEPSVKTRIEKTIDNDIITSFSIEIDYSKLGYTIPLYI